MYIYIYRVWFGIFIIITSQHFILKTWWHVTPKQRKLEWYGASLLALWLRAREWTGSLPETVLGDFLPWTSSLCKGIGLKSRKLMWMIIKVSCMINTLWFKGMFLCKLDFESTHQGPNNPTKLFQTDQSPTKGQTRHGPADLVGVHVHPGNWMIDWMTQIGNCRELHASNCLYYLNISCI